MSSAPRMTSGMTGKAEADVLNSLPTAAGQASMTNTSKPPQFLPQPIAPKLMPNNIDYSTRRNVLPCKGITHSVLRAQPPPAAAGMMPIGGVGRHQNPSMAQERPTNLPIMKFSDPFNSQFNNPLGAPA